MFKNKNDNSWPCSQREMVIGVLVGAVIIAVFAFIIK